MKNKSYKVQPWKKFLTIGLVAAAAFVGLGTVHECQAEDVLVSGRATLLQRQTGEFLWGTNTAPMSLTNNTFTATNGQAIVVPPDTDLGIWVFVQAAGVGTSNVITGFNYGWAGTNTTAVVEDGSGLTAPCFTPGYPLMLTNACNGTSLAGSYYILHSTNLFPADALRWDYVSTTQTNGVTVTIVYKYIARSGITQ